MEKGQATEVVISHAAAAADYELARDLFQEYAAAIDVDLCFQNFSAELGRLPAMYGPPTGALLIAKVGSRVAGCVGLRKLGNDTCEMKRLYVRPDFRGRHIGRDLAEAVAGRARMLGYRILLLDTLSTMEAAHALYLSMGFKPAEAYYANPLPNVRYLGLDLR